jgi:hypothetical protein
MRRVIVILAVGLAGMVLVNWWSGPAPATPRPASTPAPTPVDPNAYNLDAMKTCSEIAQMRDNIRERDERGPLLVEHARRVKDLAWAIPLAIAPDVQHAANDLGRADNSFAIPAALERASAACQRYRRIALAESEQGAR